MGPVRRSDQPARDARRFRLFLFFFRHLDLSRATARGQSGGCPPATRDGRFGARVSLAGTVAALLASGCVPALQVRTERSGPRPDPNGKVGRDPRVEFGAPSVEYSTDGQTLKLRATRQKRCATQVTTPQTEEVTETKHLGDSGHVAGNLGVAFSIALIGGLVALPKDNCGPDSKDVCSAKVNSDRATAGGVVASFAIIPLALELYNQTRGGTKRTQEEVAPSIILTPWKDCGTRPAAGAAFKGALDGVAFSGLADKNGEYSLEISDLMVRNTLMLTVAVDGTAALTDAPVRSTELDRRSEALSQIAKRVSQQTAQVRVRDAIKSRVLASKPDFTLQEFGFALLWIVLAKDAPELYADSTAFAKAEEVMRWGSKNREKVARDLFKKQLTVPSSLKILKEIRSDAPTSDALGITQTFRYEFEARNGFGAVVSESASVIVTSVCSSDPLTVAFFGDCVDELKIQCDHRSGLTSPCN